MRERDERYSCCCCTKPWRLIQPEDAQGGGHNFESELLFQKLVENIDLEKVDLENIDLEKVDLEKVDLKRFNLKKVNLGYVGKKIINQNVALVETTNKTS